MLRSILCVVVALSLCVNVALAKGKKAAGGPKTAIGTIKKVDAAAGTLTVTIPSKKKGDTDKDFTVADTTNVVITNADGTTKEVKGKDGLKDQKEGTSVKVTCDAGGAVTEVAIGGSYKRAKKTP